MLIKIYNIYYQIKNQVRDLVFAVYHELYRELFSVMVVSGSSFYIKRSYKKQIGNKFKDMSTFINVYTCFFGKVSCDFIYKRQPGGRSVPRYGT